MESSSAVSADQEHGRFDALFVVDVQHEHIAVSEANKLGIPVVGIAEPTAIRSASITSFQATTTRSARCVCT
jgi:ribosomal protein S2